MTNLETAQRQAREILGFAPMISPSKSAYRMSNPDKDPAFNAYLLYQNEGGYLEPIWHGDLELTECGPQLVQLSLAIAKHTGQAEHCAPNLFVYYESTVHNETFNGRPFPYAEWTASVRNREYMRRKSP